MIRLEGLSIDLPGFRLEPLSLSVEEGEFFMVVGPSGAGKTMLLEAVAGLRPVSGGRIYLEDRELTHLPPEKRGVALVYQDYALFPHLSVKKNITYGLRFQDRPDHAYVEHLVDLLRLRHLLDRSPETLSGGEMQRVALARALAVHPRLLLLDEPLSALDPRFREELQDYLGQLNAEGITCVMVTHDFGEVLSLGDRVAVLHQGALQQIGAVKSVFHAPANRVVAEFVGMKNVFPASAREGLALLDGGGEFVLPEIVSKDSCFVGVRPEDVILASGAGDDDAVNAFSGRVVSVLPRGMAFEVVLQTGGFRLTSRVLSSTLMAMDIHVGDTAWMRFKPEAVHVF